jgi:hypothetical protein
MTGAAPRVDAQAAHSQFDEFCLGRLDRGQSGQCIIQRQQVHRRCRRHQAVGLEGHALVFATMLEPALAAGVFDEDAAHRLGGRREEMTAAVPVLGLLHVN